MSMLATKVALQAVKLGAHKVPEGVWDSIPGMRPPKEEREKTKKEKKGKERGSRHHHRRRSEGADSKHHRDEDKHRRSDERPRHRRRASSYSPHRSDDSDSNSDREHSRRRRRRDREHDRDRGRHDSSFDRWDHQHQPAAPYSPPGTVPTYNPAVYPHASYGQHVAHPAYPAAPPVPPIQSPPVTYASPQSPYVGIPASVQASMPYSATPPIPVGVQHGNSVGDSRSGSVLPGAPMSPPYHGTPQGPGGYAHPPPPPPPPTAQNSRPTSQYGPVPSSTAAQRYTPGVVPPTNTAPQQV